MSELLLQTIVEKLGVLESLLKQVVADKDETTNQNQWAVQLQAIHADIKKMANQLLLNQDKMTELELNASIERTVTNALKKSN